MFVVRLVGGRAAREKKLRVVILFGDVIGVIVRDVVIVPDHQPGSGGVRVRKIVVGTIQSVPGTVIIEREAHRRIVVPDFFYRVTFINIVADVHDEVEIVGHHVTIRGVVPLLVVLATDDAEFQVVERSTVGRSGAGASDGTTHATGLEPVPVVSSRIESRRLYVDGVRPLGSGVVRAMLYDRVHTLVGGDRPIDRDDLRWHASARLERRRCETCPQHHAVRSRVTRSNT